MHFERVIGIDSSETQLASAFKASNVTYLVGNDLDAVSALLPGTVDLITVAQALHWMNVPRLSARCALLLRPGGLLALWNYPTCTLSPEPCDTLLHHLDTFLMETGCWPSERKHVEDDYKALIPQFDQSHFVVEARKCFPIEKSVTVNDFVKYLSTWSGIAKYQVKNPGSPSLLEKFENDVRSHLVKDEQLLATFLNRVWFLRRR
jgi:hypothetical protein